MLPLTDPLWEKLDSAYRDQDIPRLLFDLGEAWDKDKASRIWGEICHQGSCYGSTYAAVPHLLKLAEPDGNREQRFEIAPMLAHIALCALEPELAVPLPGLPEDLKGWDETLDCYRTLVAMYEQPDRPNAAYERSRLPRYKAIIAIDPVNAADLEKIKSIRVDFLSALPRICALCERTLLESIEDDLGIETFLLSGIAAAEGLLGLSRLLESGAEGRLWCAACDWSYEYHLYGDRVAIYAEPAPDSGSAYNEHVMLDYKDEAPSRADGFIVPAGRDGVCDARALRLLSLADRSPSPEPGLLLRSFLGHIQCCRCGARAAIRGGLVAVKRQG
jgi:hypothetical protein